MSGLKMSITCDECKESEDVLAGNGATLKAPDGWGVFTIMFKIQSTGRVINIGGQRQRQSSAGIGQRLRALYLCPSCLRNIEVRRERGIDELCTERGILSVRRQSDGSLVVRRIQMEEGLVS